MRGRRRFRPRTATRPRRLQTGGEKTMAEPALHAVLRNARIAAGQLQADVAAALGVTQTALSYWENGRRSPSLADLERWAKAVGCRIVVAPKRQSCGCGDDRLYWRGWDDCATAAVQAMAKGHGAAGTPTPLT